jgi:hypothetical protein
VQWKERWKNKEGTREERKEGKTAGKEGTRDGRDDWAGRRFSSCRSFLSPTNETEFRHVMRSVSLLGIPAQLISIHRLCDDLCRLNHCPHVVSIANTANKDRPTT